MLKYRDKNRNYDNRDSTIYDASSVPILPLDTSSVTRGNYFKLSDLCFYHDTRKCAFVPSTNNIWNSLPDFVVKVDSINVFKKRLDKYWSYQDFMGYIQEYPPGGSITLDPQLQHLP